MDNEIINYLTTLISFRSTADEPHEKLRCLDWIAETFFSNTELIRGDIAGSPYLYYKHPNAKLLWFAHLDVVPAQEHQLTLEIEGDTLKGRGVKDMKGPALTLLLAWQKQREQGTEPPVSILLTTDEEVAGPTIPTLLKEGTVTAPVAYTPDAGSEAGIVVEHKGVAWAKLTAEGVGTHSALPWEGTNPITLLVKVLADLQDTFPMGNANDWQITVTPTSLQAGSSAYNQVPSNASAVLDIRFPPQVCTNADAALEMLRTHLPNYCRLDGIIGAAPLQTNNEHPAVLDLQAIASEVEEKQVPIGKEHGSTDARYFSSASIPAFIWGPKGGGIHGKSEWVSMQSLLQHVEIYQRWLAQL